MQQTSSLHKLSAAPSKKHYIRVKAQVNLVAPRKMKTRTDNITDTYGIFITEAKATAARSEPEAVSVLVFDRGRCTETQHILQVRTRGCCIQKSMKSHGRTTARVNIPCVSMQSAVQTCHNA